VEFGITQDGLNLLDTLDLDQKKWIEKNKGIGNDEARILNSLLDKMRG
jgi:hypothetical protein